MHKISAVTTWWVQTKCGGMRISIVLRLDRRGEMEPGGLEEQWCQEGSGLRDAL